MTKPKKFIAGALTLLVLVILAGLAYRAYMQNTIKTLTKITSKNGVDALKKVLIGGSDQWIYVRGQNIEAPVLLYLHGGPGMTSMPTARAASSILDQNFVVVHWDQRGSGKSSFETFSDSSLTLDQYVADTIEMTEYLLSEFGQQKIYLLGHSWGTLLGTRVARDRPDLLHAYVGMGQLVDMKVSEVEAHEHVVLLATAAGRNDVLDELEKLKPPYINRVDEFLTQRKWLFELEEPLTTLESKPPNFELFSNPLWSPEYSTKEASMRLYATLKLLDALWGDMLSVNFREESQNFDVPVYFFTGRHDPTHSPRLVIDYYKSISAPTKELIWFENSGHSPDFDEPVAFQKALIERVLQQH